MEGDTQTAAEPQGASSGPSAESAPAASTGGPSSWEAAFADDAGASNSGPRAEGAQESPASSPSSAPSNSTDGASNAEAAPASEAQSTEPPKAEEPAKPDGQRDRQPGSRADLGEKLTAAEAENARMREQFETWAKERDERRQADQKRQEDEAAAKAEAEAAVEGILGKPGEMAQLLQKRAAAQRSGNWQDFTQEDEDRLTRLTEGALLYQPLMERARAEARAEIGQSSDRKVAEAEGRAQGLLNAWAAQFDAMESLDLAGFDARHVRQTIDNLPDIVRAAHAAGASSRDGEIADLKGQLTDARGAAFVSQPHMATGGVSGSGRTERGYDPSRSPVSNLEAVFAEEPAAASTNGRR